MINNKVPERNVGKEDKFLSDLWWVPLTWATNLLGRMGVNAPKEQMIIPKDHKNTIKAMQKYKRELESQKTCGQNSLPSFYKKVTFYHLWKGVGA